MQFTAVAQGAQFDNLKVVLTGGAAAKGSEVVTYTAGTNTMTIIFPRCNVVSSLNLDNQAEDVAAVNISFKSVNADS